MTVREVFHIFSELFQVLLDMPMSDVFSLVFMGLFWGSFPFLVIGFIWAVDHCLTWLDRRTPQRTEDREP
jgi:hypothetical protein